MNRSERLNQELIFLSYRQTFHVKELMQEFNISKRTALRDISSLEQLGLSFYVEPVVMAVTSSCSNNYGSRYY